MIEMLQYTFFQNAIIGVIIIAIASAMIGTYIVSRRLVAISGGVTHACFGGLGLSYFFGINPIVGAGVFAVGAAMGVEWLAGKHRVREDSAIAVVWALGMAIGILFVFLTPGYVPELNSFLFGNVLTIQRSDLWAFAIFTIVLILFFALRYKQIVVCAFDRDFAHVINLPVRLINYTMTVMTAICIVLTIRLVGIMLLMSMLALPQMVAEVYCRRFKTMMWLSIAISIFCCLAGLFIGAIIDVPCSALIVITMIVCYVIVKLCRHLKLGVVALLALIVMSGAMTSCGKRNTAANRKYTAFITRYNIYFNGNEHYKETLKSMEESYQDDYSKRLFMHPAEAYNDEKSPQPSGDFKRSIEKAQKAIQIRSIKKRPARKSSKMKDPEYKKWLQREEYNPFLHNAWMMMGRSQYLNGDFLGAVATFFYISKHFWWLPETVTEAKLWEARSYLAADWLFEAESIITRIKEKDLTNKTLEELYYFDYADFYVKSHMDKEAVPMLEKAIKYAKGAQKTRLQFLLGQIYADLGMKTEAYEAFKKAGSGSGVDYRTKFNARIKQSEVYQGDNIQPEVKALLKMTKYGRNQEFLDQIYYAVGNLYLSRADTINAIANYEKAIKESTRSGIDKAIAQLTLGRLYFEQQRYDLAQPCYSEAIPMIPETYPDYKALKKRSDVLDELAIYSQNVVLQDSLLRLSELSPEEQMKVANRLIDELKKREKEEAENAKREEYLAQQAAMGNGLQPTGNSAPTAFSINNDNSWYFYNQATRNAGKTDFQKRWGNRKLEDDWRRRNKASFSFSDIDGDQSADDADSDSDTSPEEQEKDADAKARENDPHYPEYYIKQIPKTAAEKQTANDVIQEGLYEMGVILKDKLEDFGAAEKEFNELLTRYPDNQYRLDTYYNLYLMYMRQGRTEQAEKWRQLILSDFPDSKYGEALTDPDYINKLREMAAVQEALYDEAYQAYLDDKNAEVHAIYDHMRQEYPMSSIMPKFMFIEALTYVTENKPEKFDATLRDLLERYPEADVSQLASSYLTQLSQGKSLHSSGSNLNMRGMVWATRLTNDSVMAATPDQPAEFDLNDNGPQLLVLLYPTNRVQANQLLYDVARFNFNSFTVRDFDLEQMKFGDLGLLIVKGFTNPQELNRYRSMLESGTTIKLPEGVIPVSISEKNFETMLREGRSFDEYFEATGDARLEELHRSVLPEEEYPSAHEMYDMDSAPDKRTDADKAKADKTAGNGADSDEFDIPLPPPPSPNAPRLQPVYPIGSEGDDPLFD